MSEGLSNTTPSWVQNPSLNFNQGKGVYENVWLEIFQKCSSDDLSNLGLANKAWKKVVIQYNAWCSKIVSTFYEKVFIKWKDLSETQKKPAPWHDIQTKEQAIDEKLINGAIKDFSEISYDMPPWETKEATLLADKLIIIESNSALKMVSTTKNSVEKLLDKQHQICEVEKLSDASFVSIDLKKVILWRNLRLTQSRENQTRKFFNKPLEKELFFNDKSLVYTKFEKTKDLSFFHLDFYLLDAIFHEDEKPYRMQIESKSKSQEILKLTEEFLIITDAGKNVFSIYYRKKELPALHTQYIFLTLQKERALFFNRAENCVLEKDLSKATAPFISLFEMQQCLGGYMTEKEYYFVGEGSFHIYAVDKKEKSSWMLLESENQFITKCDFIRVTANVVMFSLRIRENNERYFEQIFVINLKELKEENRLINLWAFPKTCGFYLFSDSYVVSFRFEREICLIKAYEFGIPSFSHKIVPYTTFVL